MAPDINMEVAPGLRPVDTWKFELWKRLRRLSAGLAFDDASQEPRFQQARVISCEQEYCPLLCTSPRSSDGNAVSLAGIKNRGQIYFCILPDEKNLSSIFLRAEALKHG